MSRKGHCRDNALMTSFSARLKVGLIYAEGYKPLPETYTGLIKYIDVFYNLIRRNSSSGYISPAKNQKYIFALRT